MAEFQPQLAAPRRHDDRRRQAVVPAGHKHVSLLDATENVRAASDSGTGGGPIVA